jgi:uncharacterized membrane protein
MLLARRWRWIDKVSPMAVLYVVGLLVANLTPWLHDSQLLATNNLVGNICIPLAIPMMLIACSLSNWSTGKALKAFLSGLVAVLVVTIAGFFLFRGQGDLHQFAQVCAVAVGIYTGGIPNMGAIAQGVGMDQTTYLYVTSYDLIITGLYLVFVICFGKPLFRLLLGNGHQPKPATSASTADTPSPTPFQRHVVPALLGLLIAVVSYLLSTLFTDSLSTPMLILILTTLAIAASFLPIVRHVNNDARHRDTQPTSFTLGLYFVYLFCFSIANACDIRQLDLTGSLNILWYILFIIFGSLILQILFARLIHLDGDTTLVTSVTLINSPPFVPLVAALLGNRELIVTGITIGLIGYLVGNYLGLGLFFLLAP